ncbi:MAG: HDOD domain-containing protein [Gallionella sp.]|nr:HDOD domain-containing protein [Gallionella sp.]
MLKRRLEKIDTLPAMPTIAQKLLSLKIETFDGESALLKLIEQDPQLSAKIIGLANSPLLSSSRKTSSINGAAMLLGMSRVKSIAIGIAAISALTQMPQSKLNVTELWLHSLTVALSMRAIAQFIPEQSRPDDDQIFLAGLLHDIGYLVLSYLDTKLSDQLHEQICQEHSTISTLEIEQNLLGITHCELSAQLALNWGLENNIVSALRNHHLSDFFHNKDSIDNTLAVLITLAEKLLPSFGATNLEKRIGQQEWELLGIDPDKSEDIYTSVNNQIEHAKQLAI